MIVIHCSDTPNGRPHDAAELHRWHLERGWDGIGYHYVIKIDGSIEAGRPEYWTGSHVRGHNTGSIGICLIGRDEFTPQQYDALGTLVKYINRGASYHRVVGHYELDSKKTCPNFDVQEWLTNGMA